MANKVTPCLWFNSNAQEAVDFYLGIFKKGKILSIDYYTDVGEEITGHKKGDILTIECRNQQEIDYYWEKLSADPSAEQCGWLQDKYGLSWQVSPKILVKMLKEGSPEQRKRVTELFMEMKKFDIDKLKEGYRERS